jgi:gentisate 1,2-dioxygenase/2-polyprenyl-6-methoxyphenol hydroxylase-like FAD-dependent oxidoreductase
MPALNTDNESSFDTEVLVIGAGPVGLALAGDLGWRGHRCVLADEGDGVIGQPKMDLVGIRTMEFCRRWGIVGDVESAPYDRDYPQDNVYLTSLNGYELGRQPMPSMRANPYPPESPQRRERCPQNMFDPVLQKFARSQAGVDIRYKHRFISFKQDESGVTSRVLDIGAGREFDVRSKFLVGCDGAKSAVREQLGIPMSGKGLLTHTTNVIFRCAEFNKLHDKAPGYRYMFVGPAGTWATIVAINGKDQWRMSIIGNAHERPRYSEDELKAFARKALGRDFEPEILSVLRWTRAELVAQQYGSGRVYIAGDAAHLTSPTGGLGMNTGIGDAVDLSWKLAACLEGWGGKGLLDSYGFERKPVAERITRFSTSNLQTMKKVAGADKVLEPGPEGDAARAAVGHALGEGLKREWFSQNMHLGNRYFGSPVCVFNEVEDPAVVASENEDAVNYRPSTRPGCRAPHAWLAEGKSTLDLFGKSFVLVVSGASTPEAEALRGAAARRGMKLAIETLADPAIQTLYQKRFVLVRPDGHVAWRADSLPQVPDDLLDTVTGGKVNFESAVDLPALYSKLDQVKMKNGWAKPTPSLYPEPKQAFVPARWRYSDARAALHVAGRLVGTEWAERRNLIMANPVPGNDYATVRTLIGAYQMVKGGETARSHRHTPNAMRVVLEAAANTYTIVDGVKIPMLHGDVLLTPNGSFHGHSNESDQEAYWVDFLDAPLVQHLGPMFFELHPDALERADSVDPKSPMRFAYSDYLPRLLAAAPVAEGVRTLELGPPRLDTFDRVVLKLDAGATWTCPKDTVNRIFTVIEGSGSSVVNGEAFEWAPGDMLTVPSWYEHRHFSAGGAVLLQVSDAPLMHMLNWYRVGAKAS